MGYSVRGSFNKIKSHWTTPEIWQMLSALVYNPAKIWQANIGASDFLDDHKAICFHSYRRPVCSLNLAEGLTHSNRFCKFWVQPALSAARSCLYHTSFMVSNQHGKTIKYRFLEHGCISINLNRINSSVPSTSVKKPIELSNDLSWALCYWLR